MEYFAYAFLKFGSEENILDLYQNGTIYMRSIQSFRTQENDGNKRADPYEGVSQIKNYPSGTFEIPSIGHKGNYKALHLKLAYPEVLGNLYCLYIISSLGWEKPE